jgi:hypothetical protein
MERSTKKIMTARARLSFSAIGLLLVLTAYPAMAQAPYAFNRKIVNWGVKAGFNANSVMQIKAMHNGEVLSGSSFRNKTGYDVTTFLRINLDRFFIQPEAGWSVRNKDLLFSLPTDEERMQTFDLSFRTQSVHANGLIGYNITKTGPFAFNVFAGTTLNYNYYTRYCINPQNNNTYRNNDPLYGLYTTAGFSMNISNVHFDIRYAVNIFSSDMGFGDGNPEALAGITLHKRENVMSFSCGVMF